MTIVTDTAPAFIPEVVFRLAELEDDLTGIVTTMQRVIGGLVLLDQGAAVTTISEQARVTERFRVYVEGLLERLDPTGKLA